MNGILYIYLKPIMYNNSICAKYIYIDIYRRVIKAFYVNVDKKLFVCYSCM